MRIVIAVPVYEFLDHFDRVILELAERGHTIRIAAAHPTPVRPSTDLARHDRISLTTYPAHRSDAWTEPIQVLRSLRDYLHYQDPRHARSPSVRQESRQALLQRLTNQPRSAMYVPGAWTGSVDEQWHRALTGLGDEALAGLDTLLRLTETTVPSDPAYAAFLQAERPDIVLLTPLVRPGGAPATDLVKSAQALGIPIGLLAFSWDSLTTRGLIHVAPDRVFVWNEVQAADAVTLHGVPRDRIVVTGAPRFDLFFTLTPGITRAQLCEQLQFEAGEPIVTYLCSAGYLTIEEEHAFVARWIHEVRAHPALARANIIVRLHPTQYSDWRGGSLAERVAVTNTDRAIADQCLFDTLFHSDVVVGLNTSAEIEAAIVGRPVCTIHGLESIERQQGCLHFWHLLKEEGGFVEAAADFETHRRQLAAACRGDYDRAAIQAFVTRFVRPAGVERPAASVMVDAIEQFGQASIAGRLAAATA